MSEQEREDALVRAYSVRGYLVVGFYQPVKVNTIKKDVRFSDHSLIDQPLRIVCQTDEKDALIQYRLMSWGREDMPRFPHYYRVESD